MRLFSNAFRAKNISYHISQVHVASDSSSYYNKSYFQLFYPIISLETSLEYTIVRPLQKTSEPQTPSDFRPISRQKSALPKCVERVVHKQLLFCIETISYCLLFSPGFSSHLSTTTTLLKINNKQLTLPQTI